MISLSSPWLVEQHVSHSIFYYLLSFSVCPLSCCIARTYKRMPLAVSYLCPTFLVFNCLVPATSIRYRRSHISNMCQDRFRALLNQQTMTVFITGAAEHTIPLGNYHAHVLYLKTHFLICSCIWVFNRLQHSLGSTYRRFTSLDLHVSLLICSVYCWAISATHVDGHHDRNPFIYWSWSLMSDP